MAKPNTRGEKKRGRFTLDVQMLDVGRLTRVKKGSGAFLKTKSRILRHRVFDLSVRFAECSIYEIERVEIEQVRIRVWHYRKIRKN